MQQNNQRVAGGCQGRMMLAPIMEIGALLLDVESDRRVCGTGAAVMNCLGRGDERQLPTLGPEAPAPIHVLAIHEERFVEHADLVHGFAPDEPEATAENVRWTFGLVRPMRE